MLLGLLGGLLVAAASLDAVWTTIGLGGAGPISGRVSRGVWGAMLQVHRRRPSHRMLSFGATAILLAILLVWLGMLLLGWTLLFSATPEAVVHVRGEVAAGFVERLYFTGFVMTTLGMGDFVPTGGWRVAVVLCSMNGLLVITLSIAYFIPVIEAGMAGRRLATYITGLGRTPHEIVLRAWIGGEDVRLDEAVREGNLQQLGVLLVSLSEMVNSHTHRHVAYPVVHYVHGESPDAAVALRVAAVDEAVTLFEHAVAPEARPHPLVLHSLRCALSGYLKVLRDIYVAPTGEAPPPPSLEPLRRRGVPLVDEAAYARAVEELADRRRILYSLVLHDGWVWEEVSGREPAPLPAEA
jgi:hypothetical protein